MQSGNGCIRDREYILIIEVSMEQYVIKGGNPLVGEVEIGGAKNAALGILAAAIMTDETVVIDNLPGCPGYQCPARGDQCDRSQS